MSRRIVLGRGVTCNLKVPLPWLPEEVLEIQNTPELLRQALTTEKCFWVRNWNMTQSPA
jgi:hypothetical protein